MRVLCFRRSLRRRLLGHLRPPFWRRCRRADFATLAGRLGGGHALQQRLLFLASGDPHYLHCVPDDVSGVALAA
jgi:hypothetical protein